MKKYRDCIADAYALQDVLAYVADRADGLLDEMEDYKRRAEQAEEAGDDAGYYNRMICECGLRSAAFERLLAKLSK